jgi:hypothetical protein
MTNDILSQNLHDRATRGLPLSSEEQSRLQQWYAQQDHEEAAVLAQAPAREDLVKLRQQVDTAVTQLLEVTQRVQRLAGENDALKLDIISLQRQLTKTAQPA